MTWAMIEHLACLHFTPVPARSLCHFLSSDLFPAAFALTIAPAESLTKRSPRGIEPARNVLLLCCVEEDERGQTTVKERSAMLIAFPGKGDHFMPHVACYSQCYYISLSSYKDFATFSFVPL